MDSAVIGPSWQESFFDLREAATPEELWAVLLVPHGYRSSSVWSEPYALFRRLHEDDRTDAVTTALLLCTDYRWRKATHHLIHELEESDLLAEQALDLLAECFLASDIEVDAPRHLFVGAPMFFTSSTPASATTVAVELPRQEDPRRSRSGRRREADLVSVARSVWPPLRRWAAARQLRSATALWAELVAIAAGLPSRDEAMLLAGVMDAADAIPESERTAAIDLGLTSGSGIVRLAALPALAALAGPDAAKRRAAADSSEKVRAWGEKAARPHQLSIDDPPESVVDPQRSEAECSPHGDQPSLF